MAKPEWGAKRQCPKCSTRFYDLGKDNPIVCISCGHEFHYEPLLKSRRPRDEVEEAPKKVAAKAAPPDETEEEDEVDIDVDVDVDVDSDDEEVLGIEDDGEDDDVSGVIVKKVEGSDE